ncbi:hypothetical protein LBMAG49_12720 [Planctomycetota bacterium]|nr:hypothetical protein LBMAG49_12720 [Planctomycetota bacterium]
MTQRVFHVGVHPGVRAALEAAFGTVVLGPVASDLRQGDVICLEAFADVAGREDLPGRNVYSACRAYKEHRGVAVYIAVRADDKGGPQLARFVLADSVLTVKADGSIQGAEVLAGIDHGRPGRKMDALIARFGSAFESAEKNSQALARLLQWEGGDSCIRSLQDEETGLLNGPYTALKLDEEFRRSQRFHQPLSLVLLDIGRAASLLPAGPDRRSLLAEVAAVFLNECRDIDVLGRFTPSIFLFLLPGTPPDGAATLAKRMLVSLRQRNFAGRIEPIAGVAAMPDSGIADRKTFLLVAETCLERARSSPNLGGLSTAWE